MSAADESIVPEGADVAEMIVLLDERGQSCGVMPKSQVHTTDTPLHLAFSCLIVDEAGRILLTRRALSKTTWPGVWTGACCGHPAPGEPVEAAVIRRVRFELGCEIADLDCIDQYFRYRAVSAEGIVENEVCPVYRAHLATDLAPRSDEVAEFDWAQIGSVVELAQSMPFVLSPWLVMQLARKPIRRALAVP